MRVLATVALGLGLVGCGSDVNEDTAPGTSQREVGSSCAAPNGVYTLTQVLRGGSCAGSAAETIVRLDDSFRVLDYCGGLETLDEGTCSTEVAVVCERDADREDVSVYGAITWMPDGSRGEGVWSVSLVDPLTDEALCSDTYDVLVERI